MVLRSLLTFLFCTALMACDDISEAIGAQPEQSETPAQNQSTSQTASPPSNPADTKLNEHTISMPQAMALNVFDIVLDMPVEDVKALLLEKGFEEPSIRRMSELVDTFEASIGYNCDFKYRGTDEGICDRIGTIQDSGYIWTRGPLIDGEAEEQLLPLFYVDDAKQLRLWHVLYERSYEPAIFPGTIADQMLDRFGKPTFHHKDEALHGVSYYIQMDVPPGYERTDEDERSSARFTDQRAVKATRISCLEQEVENFPQERTPLCETVFNHPANQQRIFDALNTNPNQVLNISIKPETLRLEFTGRFLPRATALSIEETTLIAQLAELARRRDAEADIADDL